MIFMQKKLSSILQSFSYKAVAADGVTPLDGNLIGGTPVTDPVYDSRDVTEGSIFFALPGTHINGNKFIAMAIDKGANAIIYQGEIEKEEQKKIGEAVVRRAMGNLAEPDKKTDSMIMPVFLKVEDSRLAMAPVSDAFYDSPSKKLAVIGITGTEGKSSTVSFVWQLLRLAGKKAGFISTVEYSLGGDALPNPQHATTPEATIIHHHLAQMVENGCQYAVIESSSHGLSKKLGRLDGVCFDCGIFMNVTLEHLEFHKTFEQYRSDKANLFRALDGNTHKKTISGTEVHVPAFGVVNLEDPSAEYFCNATEHKVYGFTTEGMAGRSAVKGTAEGLPEIPQGLEYLTTENIVSTDRSVSFDVKGLENFSVSSGLPGAFNAYNIMASIIAVSRLTGISMSQLAEYAKDLVPVSGRMTIIDEGQPFEVTVDYAHTPSSFETIFPPIRKRCKGKIFALFGSGGERDLTKRPLQGKIAAEYCDVVILTDEDPRGEDSVALLSMIAEGAVKAGKTEGKDLLIIPDRPSAIRKAFSMAIPGDIVLLLGKGHENSIIYKDRVMPYDEAAEARKALAEMGYKK